MKNSDLISKIEIPKIIHQTWKDKNIPEKYLDFQSSWKTHLPDWEYRLWTDEDNRDFLEKNYEWFLPIYDGYSKPIMRADAIRYFWMYHFGGLYVDLDFESLKSVEPLLKNQKIVIGLEPQDHLQKSFLQKYGFQHILCNAFMASEPKASFWKFMITQLIKNQKEENPLVATGPFCLTQAYDSFQGKENITLLQPEILYPISDENQNDISKINLSEAYGIHHWAGSWWRGISEPPPSKLDIFAANLRARFPRIFRLYDKILNRPTHL